jgi:hypothetical protein
MIAEHWYTGGKLQKTIQIVVEGLERTRIISCDHQT